MTPEEKARAYDLALERASKLRFQNPFDTVSQMMEHVFPELKKSEDERIIKALVDVVSDYPELDLVDKYGVDLDKILKWLAKQGEQKPFDYENATIIQKDFAPKEVTCTQEVETGNGNIKALVTEKLDSTNTSTEDEDERIRKSIIAILNNYVDNSNTFKPKMLAWLEKQGNIDLEFFENGENEKREFVGYGFLKCKGDFLSFKEGETYWLEYVGKDNYNVRSDNLLGQTFHITPQQLYTVFRPTTWLEKQGQVNETIIPQHEDKTCKENNDSLTSEDERIRKAIIATIHLYYGEPLEDEAKEMLAWLEKQGNVNALIQEAAEKSYTEGMRVERKRWLEKQGEKPTLPKWRYKEDNTPLLRDSIILNKYGCVAKSPSGAIISDAWVLDYDELAKLPKEEITKQGEQKYMPKYKIGDYVKNTNYKGEPIYEIIYMDKECYICEYRGKERMGDKAVMHFSFDNPYLRLVQKPTDKVEPKFHVGEWIVWKDKYYKVNYNGCGYELIDQNGLSTSLEYGTVDKNARLLSIKDAKDGDVLASGHLVFIFKVIHGVWLNCHCSAHNDGSFIADSYDLMANKYFSEVHPATKEQRGTLTKAMANAGWEFDFDKKELRKIEQNLASSAKNCKNDTILDLLQKMPSYITVDGIFYHFMLRKTTISYLAFYEGDGECSGKVIFWMTAYSPIDLLNEMLEKLKEKGLLE